MRDAFAAELLKLAHEDHNIELLTGDLGFGVLRPFKTELPDQFHNVGIAEQLLIEMATGMALAGKKVVCYSIGNFPVFRCLEQIRNDAAYSGANVKIIAIGGGYTYGGLGMSHNATEDIAVLRPIPNIAIYTPCDKYEAVVVTDLMMAHEGTTYLRLERPDPATIHEGPVTNYVPGTPLLNFKGKKTAVLSYGGIALRAKKVAEKMGYAFYTFPMIKHLDEKAVIKELGQYEKLVVIEEHSKIGGLGSAMEDIFVTEKRQPRIIKFGIPDEVAPVVGSQDYMRDYVGLNVEAIIQLLKKD
jgi:transketolase